MEKYLVGGAVRDILLGLSVKERDWVVVGATSKEMINAGYHPVGKDFPVFLHPENREEHALARMERKSGHGYTNFICYFSPEVTLEEDLRRRDLTINAIAIDENGNIFDPYKGQIDMKKRILRHVSNAFSEDPLRVLRVARFAAKFFNMNFNIAPETMLLMRNMFEELYSLSPERIWKETIKALSTDNPQIYFKVLRECGALKILFPEIDALFGIPAPVKWHPEIDTGIHTLLTVSIAASLSKDVSVRFATLCHDLGKALTPKTKLPHHPGHGIAGVKIIDTLCQRLRIPNALRDLAKIVAEYHDLLHNVENITPNKLMHLFYDIDVWRKPERLDKIIISSKADALGRYGFEKNSYPQENFIREAYYVANSVNASKVLSEGFTGIQVSQELRFRRKTLLEKWKNNIKMFDKNQIVESLSILFSSFIYENIIYIY